MCQNKNNETEFPRNCGNCTHSSWEVSKDDMVMCEKNMTLEKFEAEKDCYE